MFKVIIAGGRKFQDYDLLESTVSHLIQNKTDVQIVSGGAKGADVLGERFAGQHNLKLQIFMAKWDEEGLSAGYRRNQRMAEYADALIAFWDGKSKGTGHMIDIAKREGLAVRVVRY